MPPKGFKLSEEAKRKIGLANSGKKRSDESKQKMRDAQNKRYEDPNERAKYSRKGSLNPNYGKKISEEQRNKISMSMRGKCDSIETKIRKSLSHVGKKKSEEHKQKISESQKGKSKSAEEIEKNRISHIGKTQSEETKQKLRDIFSKDGNPSWKGGITPLNHSIRTSNQMVAWRNAVFSRDDYTCQFTGVKGCTLDAHHIVSFATIMEKYNIQTIDNALECKELWDVDNGISIEHNIHIQMHIEGKF